MIRRSRCWPGAARRRPGSVPKSVMIDLLAAPPRRQWPSASPATAAVNIRPGISRAGRACCKLTPMPDTTSFTTRSDCQGLLHRPCIWSHARRKFFEQADVEGNIRKGKDAKEVSPIAFDAVRRIDALFDIEREINGADPADRLEARQRLSAPLVEDLERWLRGERALLSKHAKVAKAIDYLLAPNHWPGFTRFLDDGRVCLTNNAAERSLRGVTLGRKSWLFAGSERGGHRAAFMYSLIGTAKLNDIDPQAWLADVIARISDMSVSRLHELLPWEWSQPVRLSTEAA